MTALAAAVRGYAARLRGATGSRLYRKYALSLALAVCVGLLGSGIADVYFAQHELRTRLTELHREKAVFAAWRVEQFFREIERQMGWLAALPVERPLPDLRLDMQRLLRQVPAISEMHLVNGKGRELLFISRFNPDKIGSGRDWSREEIVRNSVRGGTYVSPVYFRNGTEPYLRVAVREARPDGDVLIAEVNLKTIWRVISDIRIGDTGYSYAVDESGRLVAHPDLTRVLSRTSVATLPQVQSALARLKANGPDLSPRDTIGTGAAGASVMSTDVPLPFLHWVVFVEQPLAEANAPIRDWSVRAAGFIAVGLVLALLVSMKLARNMVQPIEALRYGAQRLASGALDHRIDAGSGDELQEVGEQFNAMAARLEASYADLERRIEERTRELAIANRAMSRFLAAASHDLRQPIHAIGLLMSSLKGKSEVAEMRHAAQQAGAAIEDMADLLDSLLDISKLDVGAVAPAIAEFPVSLILQRVAFHFEDEARRKGIRLKVVQSCLGVRSDPTMLRRIAFNLVSNAIRYTRAGKILVGCRREGDTVRLQVLDTGIGIPRDQHDAIFQEFFQVSGSTGNVGLGLGLSIVKRLAEVLGHRIEVASEIGKGSVFTVRVPGTGSRAGDTAKESPVHEIFGAFANRSVLVVDDDARVLDAMHSLLGDWGCAVTSAESEDEALTIAASGRRFDAVVCDYNLRGGDCGLDLVHQLARMLPGVACILMTANTDPGVVDAARREGYYVLHKPVRPAKLRGVLTHLFGVLASRSAGAPQR